MRPTRAPYTPAGRAAAAAGGKGRLASSRPGRRLVGRTALEVETRGGGPPSPDPPAWSVHRARPGTRRDATRPGCEYYWGGGGGPPRGGGRRAPAKCWLWCHCVPRARIALPRTQRSSGTCFPHPRHSGVQKRHCLPGKAGRRPQITPPFPTWHAAGIPCAPLLLLHNPAVVLLALRSCCLFACCPVRQ